MTQLFLILFSLALTGGAIAQSKPPAISYPEARKLYNQFDRTLSQVGLWEKKALPERRQLLEASLRHRDAVYKAFGDISACGAAATTHVEFITNLNAISYWSQGGLQPKPFDLLSAMRFAEQFGLNRMGCYDAVEALDTVARK